ncbi:hypothetical protein J2Z32_004252, partial [Paenibacillus turicensis]
YLASFRHYKNSHHGRSRIFVFSTVYYDGSISFAFADVFFLFFTLRLQNEYRELMHGFYNQGNK